ncbi:MAG: hypothetical protein WBA84_02755, partial [Carnobacterium sp.]|uniref:hypothetical protein n=1 Tax=Carnobacterium sp. TaxID=48221 RepID=UPI003C745DA0
MKAKQDIVPVTLANDSKSSASQLFKPKASPSTLVARVKFSRTELFLYEEIKADSLRIILS